MKPTLYTVQAYRWGDRECHSYTVGVFSKKHAALKEAKAETDYRGGKYECEVLEWVLDDNVVKKVVLALPTVNALIRSNREHTT